MISDWSWGNCYTVAIHQDTLAVVGNGAFVHVIDVANPDSPKIVGEYRTYSGVKDVAIRDSLAYVLTGGRLLILNLRDTHAPSVVSETDITGSASLKLVLDSTFAYVLLWGGLEVVDISNPVQPVVRPGIAISEYAFNLAVRNHFVYVGSLGDPYVLIVDARNPGHLQIANFLWTDGYTPATAIVDTLLFIGGSTAWNYFDIFSISDSANPRFIARDTIGYGLELEPTFITVADSIAYMTTVDSGLYAIRVSDITAPTTVGHVRRSNARRGNDKIGLGRGILAVASITGLWTIRSPEPDSLKNASFFVTGDTPGDMALYGNYAVIAQSEAGLAVLDISDPFNPRRVGVLELPRKALDYGYGVANHIALEGNYAYVLTGFSIDIVDVGNPLVPRLASSYPVKLFPYNALAIQKDHLFLVRGDSGIVVLALPTPDSLIRSGSYFSSAVAMAFRPAVQDSIMLVPAVVNGLQWFDISEPDTPLPTANIGGFAGAVVIRDTIAYATVGSGGSTPLVIFSLGDIRNPRILGSVDSIEGELGLSGNYIYGNNSSWPNKLVCVDIRDPYRPFLASSVQIAGGTSRILAQNEYVYALDGFGFYVFKNSLVTSVENSSRRMPQGYSLEQNYPNPFNPSTQITYELPRSGMVVLVVYDVLGREIATLVNERKPAGEYTVRWNAGSTASGVYFYRLQAGSFIETKKMLLLR